MLFFKRSRHIDESAIKNSKYLHLLILLHVNTQLHELRLLITTKDIPIIFHVMHTILVTFFIYNDRNLSDSDIKRKSIEAVLVINQLISD